MSLPHHISHAIHQTLPRTTLRHQAPNTQWEQVHKAVQTLQHTYRNRKDDPMPALLKGREEAVAYLASRLPATYAVCQEVLAHLKPYQDRVHTVCDLGAGPGTASIAALENIGHLKHITLMDQVLNFQGFMEDALAPYKCPYIIRKATLPFTQVPEDRFNLVIMSYALNELPQARRAMMVQQAWQLCDAFLVLIEPGTPAGFQNIEIARHILKEQGARVVAPCPHLDDCPLQLPEWCHFSCRLPRSALHQQAKQAILNFEDEKYSYLVVAKAQDARSGQARIIKRPLKGSGHTILDLCTTQGLKRFTISKKHKESYKQSRKLAWGDHLPSDWDKKA